MRLTKTPAPKKKANRASGVLGKAALSGLFLGPVTVGNRPVAGGNQPFPFANQRMTEALAFQDERFRDFYFEGCLAQHAIRPTSERSKPANPSSHRRRTSSMTPGRIVASESANAREFGVHRSLAMSSASHLQRTANDRWPCGLQSEFASGICRYVSVCSSPVAPAFRPPRPRRRPSRLPARGR